MSIIFWKTEGVFQEKPSAFILDYPQVWNEYDIEILKCFLARKGYGEHRPLVFSDVFPKASFWPREKRLLRILGMLRKSGLLVVNGGWADTL